MPQIHPARHTSDFGSRHPKRRRTLSPALRTQHAALPLRGFTLVELLVVITIIGLLVGLLIPVIGKVKRASQGAATQAQMATIATAIQSYYSDFRAYPGPFPNNELGGITYSTPQAVASATYPLGLVKGLDANGAPNSYGSFDSTQAEQVTGSENLVLGLLGGLEQENASGTLGQPCYDQYALFPSGTTPAPKGPASLNAGQPKRFSSYLQVKTGDISTGSFVDGAARPANDSVIPEFLDKSSQPMPILYLRANPGAAGVVTKGGKDETNTTATYQYDLAQVIGYTGSSIGTTVNSKFSYHGLQNISPGNPGVISDTIMSDYSSGTTGANALVYLKDPNTPAFQPNGTTATTNALASPRQKDGFILISAGPDGVYGTSDDFIYPGSLNP